MTQPETAKFKVYWDRGEEEFDVQYNPTELSFSRTTKYAEIQIPGLDSPLQQFVRGQSETLSVELFFDTTEDGMGSDAVSVTTETDKVYSLSKIDPGSHAPPVCEFFWNERSFPGSDVSANLGSQRRSRFKCIVEKVEEKFTLFSPEGVPLRATLNVTLREYKTLNEQLSELNLNSPDRSQAYVIRRGDTLSGLAGRHYRRPGQWRRIAAENAIDDPRRLEVGVVVSLPPVE